LDEARCELCGVPFDPRGFQVRVSGLPRLYHSVACALTARERLGLEGLAHPARAYIDQLASSLTRARAAADAERRRRAVLEQEVLQGAQRREALRRRERERERATAEQAAETAVAAGGVVSGPLAEKLKRRWFERP
jgi:hypothetical protein